MGSYVVHLFAVLFSSAMISEALRDGPTVVWTGEVPPLTLKVSGLRTSVPTPDADQCCVPARTYLCSNERTSTQPNVVININNFFCITGMREVNVETEKNNILNVALGNQDVKVAQACGSGGTQLMSLKPIFELPSLSRDDHRGFLTYGEQCHESKTSDCRARPNENLNGRNGHQKNGCDVLYRRIFEMPKQSPNNDKTVEDYHQLKDIFSCRDGSAPKIASLENYRVNSWSKPPIVAESNHGWAPNLKLFIGGRPVNESQSHQIENPSFNNFYEAMAASSHDGKYIGIERKPDLCDSDDDYPTWSNDAIIFHGGFELTFDQLEEIFEEISDRPGHIKLIVPSGITGQLLDYFQQVETPSVDLALQHGVCLLSNGFLVPIKPMLSVIQLHVWLSKLIPNLASESFRLLHLSMWTDTKSVLGMVRCLIKSGKVMVVLPSKQKISFDRFEQHEHQTPNNLLEQMKIELFGLSISYVVFKNGLLELCKNVGASQNT